MTPVSCFWNFASEIRKPMPYQFIVTECKGVLNIIIGLAQLLVTPCFKCFRAQRLYTVHLEAGTIAVSQGIRDLSLVIMAIVTVLFLAFLNQKGWMSNEFYNHLSRGSWL